MNYFELRKYEIDKRDEFERERIAMQYANPPKDSCSFLTLFGVALVIASIALLTYVIAGIVTGNIW